jgi:hypothetical protein
VWNYFEHFQGFSLVVFPQRIRSLKKNKFRLRRRRRRNDYLRNLLQTISAYQKMEKQNNKFVHFIFTITISILPT